MKEGIFILFLYQDNMSFLPFTTFNMVVMAVKKTLHPDSVYIKIYNTQDLFMNYLQNETQIYTQLDKEGYVVEDSLKES